MSMRTIDKLREDFASSGSKEFIEWLRNQPEGDRRRRVTSQSLPPKKTMAANVLKSGVQAVKSLGKQVSKEEQEQRHNICNSCEWYRTEDDRCAMCGCWTSHKVKLEAWHCPIKKW